MKVANHGYFQAIMLGEVYRRRLNSQVKKDIVYVEKSWGWEKWFANTANYCGKELFVKRNAWSSKGKFHYHKIKDETFYVIKGNLLLDYVDEKNLFYSVSVPRGANFRVEPGIKHRFSTITFGGCKFIEASTHHD